MSDHTRPNRLDTLPVPVSAMMHTAPKTHRVRTRLVWRRDRLAGLAIGATLTAMGAAFVLIFLMMIPPAPAPTGLTDTRSLPACVTEDSSNCYWDAAVQGNGEGRSFVDQAGHVTYVP